MSPAKTEIAVRALHADEVSNFRAKGWAFLEKLISAEDAALLLAGAKSVFERARQVSTSGCGRLEDFWYCWDYYVFEARQMAMAPFPELVLSARMGEIAAQLINRARLTDERVPIRSLGGLLFCKVGSGSASGKEVPFHQDGPAFHVDRPGVVTIWIALDEIVPEQGTMRFLEGSHREGSLGDHRSRLPIDRYPKLADQYALSSVFGYTAGDATVHDGFTMHASPENETDRSRWGYLCMYIADDVGFDDRDYEVSGFAPPLERYPVVYPQGKAR